MKAQTSSLAITAIFNYMIHKTTILNKGKPERYGMLFGLLFILLVSTFFLVIT